MSAGAGKAAMLLAVPFALLGGSFLYEGSTANALPNLSEREKKSGGVMLAIALGLFGLGAAMVADSREPAK